MLQMTTTYPKMDLVTHWPRAEIKQQVSEIQIDSIGPEIKIDQRQSRNELGMVDFGYYSHQVRDGAYQKTVEAIGKMAADGDEVVERAGRFREEMILAEQAKRAMDQKIPELSIASAPRTRPQISLNYRQEISWNQGGVSITHQVRPPELTWTLGGVEVDVRG